MKHYHGLEDLLTLKISILSKVIYRFNALIVPMPFYFFCRNRKVHSKIHVESQGNPNSQNNPPEKKIWKIHTFWFQNLLKSYSNQKQCGIGIKTDIKTNGIESPEINSHTYSGVIFDKGAKSIQWWERWMGSYYLMGIESQFYKKKKEYWRWMVVTGFPGGASGK